MGMTVYKDILSGDEVISASYDLIDKDDVVYEVDCKMITKGAVVVNTGANASAEEAEEALDDTAEQVNNVVDGFRLQKMEGAFPTIKDYQAYFKGYLKEVVEKLKEQGKSDDEIKKFQTGVSGYFSKVIKPNFKDYEIYATESMDPKGILLLLNYREDGMTPYFTIWKHALVEERF